MPFPKKFKVGFSSGFKSPYGRLTHNQYRAALLAVEQINAQGGVAGMPVELLPRDDKMKPSLAEHIAHELIEKEKVDLITGSLSAETQLNTNKIAKKFGIPFMSMSQSNVLTNNEHLGPYTFHEAISPYMTAQLVGRWGFEKLGKKWFFLIADYRWGRENYESYQIILKEMKGKNLGLIKVPLGGKEKDYAKVFDKIIRAKPEVLCVTNLGADQIEFVNAAYKAMLVRKMSIVLSISEITIIEKVLLEKLTGMYCGMTFYWGLENILPEAKAFVSAFRKRFDGELPSGYAGFAYSGMMEFLLAADAVGGRPVKADKMAEFLEGRTFNHYKGSEWWRPCDHQSFQDLYIIRFKGKEESTHQYDIGEILGIIEWDLDIERTCVIQGHANNQWGHTHHFKVRP